MTRQEPRLFAASAPLRLARKIAVAIAGTSLLVAGVALIALPGPAIVVIPLGLTVLGTEFLWPRRLVRSMKERLQHAKERAVPWFSRHKPA
jgi:tellurite resistance protein TerC